MNSDNLKYFLALAETGSLSRASEKLRVDHSIIARRIEMLVVRRLLEPFSGHSYGDLPIARMTGSGRDRSPKLRR